MEKQTILIRKIKNGTWSEQTDEVALEQEFEILLQNGDKIAGTATPTYLEELILSSRFLANDLS